MGVGGGLAGERIGCQRIEERISRQGVAAVGEIRAREGRRVVGGGVQPKDYNFVSKANSISLISRFN